MLFKIATWNVNSLRVRLSHVLQWLQEHQPTILALQELKMPTEAFPYDAFKEAGYASLVNGQKTYNGVAVLYSSSLQSDAHITDFPALADPQRRMLAATIAGVRIINLYVPNGESITSEKYSYKLSWLQHLNAFLQQELKQYSDVIVLGDFNIAPADVDVHDPKAWEGSVLCSEPERKAFRDILALGLKDCFREKHSTEPGFTWWDYRLNAFKRKMGLRIDHILSSPALATRCRQCEVDQTPRAWERPSDHAPVIAQFELAS